MLDRNAVSILMMHGVMDFEKSREWVPLRTPLSSRYLEAALKVLSKYFQFVSLDEAVGMISGRKPMKPHRMALTFDDGYRNQVKYAVPILRKFKIPATIFVVSENTHARRPFWFDRLDFALQQCEIDGMQLSLGKATIQFQSRTRAELKRSYAQLRRAAKMQNFTDGHMTEQLEQFAERLEEKSSRRLADFFESDDWTALLTWEEIRKAALDKDITFGSHSVNHRRLGMTDPTEVRYQIEESKKAIERHTGLGCEYFCYPSGSFSWKSAEMVSKFGYRAAVTTLPGSNRKGSNLFTLKRLHLPSDGNRSGILWQILQVHRLKAPMKMLNGRQSEVELIHGD